MTAVARLKRRRVGLAFSIALAMAVSPLAIGKTELAVLAAEFGDLKIPQPDGLPVRHAREDWEGARTLVRTDKTWAVWLDARRKAVDEWMAETRDKAEWVAGSGHELVDPRTDLPVEWTIKMPEPPGGNPRAEKFRQAWVWWVRSHNIDRVAEAARLYRLTGEQRYGDWAAEQLDFYAANYDKWPERKWLARSRMMGPSLDEATSVIKMLEAARNLGAMTDGSRTTIWRDRLFLPIANNLKDFDQGVTNIMLWHAVAVTLVGRQFGNEALANVGLEGKRGVRALVEDGVTSDFLWYEGTFTYNAYVLRALESLFVAASLGGWDQSLTREMLTAQNMLLAPLRLRFDDGMLPTPGDSYRLRAVDLGLFRDMYRALPTGIGLIEAARAKTWDTLLDPVTNPPPAMRPLPSVESAHFEGTRMAILKGGNWQVFLHYGQLTSNHAQEEALSTEIYCGDTPVSSAAGTTAYGSPLHEDYYRRAAAHNVPVVDGQGQIGWAPGLMKRFDKARLTLEAEQPAYRPDATASRRIAIEGRELHDRLEIRLKDGATAERRLGFLFNTQCQVDFKASGLDPGVATPAPAGAGFSYWTNVIERPVGKAVHLDLDCGKKKLKATFAFSGSGRLFHASAPFAPGAARREVLYFERVGRDAALESTLTERTE